jgi:hypothetical protein
MSDEQPDHESIQTAPEPVQSLQEQAFRAEYEYRGKMLEPWSHVRKTAAEMLGLRYGFKTTADNLYEVDNPSKPGEKVTLYDGMLHDCAIVLWLCSQPDSTCRKARRQPALFESAIDKWADENGIDILSPTIGEASEIFMGLITGENNAKGVPAKQKGLGDHESPN